MKKALVELIVYVGVLLGFTLSLSAQVKILYQYFPAGAGPCGDLITDGTYYYGWQFLYRTFQVCWAKKQK